MFFLRSASFVVATVAMVSAARGNNGFAALDEEIRSGLEAIHAERWQEAHVVFSQAVEKYGKLGIGKTPTFGKLYYWKGLCELRLKNWQAAERSFQDCYTRYPGTGNEFHKLSLLRWGEACMGAENWTEAVVKFRKFLDERDKAEDVFTQGPFYCSLAICQYRSGEIREGNESLSIAIRNRKTKNFASSWDGLFAALQTMIDATLKAGNVNELTDFLSAHQSDLIPTQEEDFSYTRQVLSLAAACLEKGADRPGFLFLQMIPLSEKTEKSTISAVFLLIARLHEKYHDDLGAQTAKEIAKTPRTSVEETWKRGMAAEEAGRFEEALSAFFVVWIAGGVERNPLAKQAASHILRIRTEDASVHRALVDKKSPDDVGRLRLRSAVATARLVQEVYDWELPENAAVFLKNRDR